MRIGSTFVPRYEANSVVKLPRSSHTNAVSAPKDSKSRNPGIHAEKIIDQSKDLILLMPLCYY